MRSQMAADQDRAIGLRTAWRRDARSRERRIGSRRLRRSGGRAGSRARNRAVLAASAGQVVSIGQSASRAALARYSASRIRVPRRGRTTHRQPTQKAQNRVATRRPQPAQRGQEQFVKNELPAQNARILRAERDRPVPSVIGRLTSVVLVRRPVILDVGSRPCRSRLRAGRRET